MINQYFIPENESTIRRLKDDMIRLRNHYHCPPTLTPANRDRKANWAYEKWIEPLEEGLVR